MFLSYCFMTLNKHNIIYGILIGIIAFLSVCIFNLTHNVSDKKNEIYSLQEYGKSIQIYYDREISELKKENKNLYDSIKSYKNDLDYALSFKYDRKYIVDTVFIEKEKDMIEHSNIYTYNGSKNDSLEYKLTIGSFIEPSWYMLDISVKDEFTIINRSLYDRYYTEISSSNGGIISDITAFKQKSKKNFFNNFSFGPSATIGYDPFNKNIGLVIGFGVNYNIFGK